jgi:hypothetical protein
MSKYPTPYRWVPKNPKKYAGDFNNIWVRSSWEKKLFCFIDNNPSFILWNSEEIVIPYVSPVDNQVHRYFVDILVKFKTKTGEIKTWLIEVKPFAQTQPPAPKKRKTKQFLTEVMTYEVNKAKWEAATKFAKAKGIEFKIFTERELKV